MVKCPKCGKSIRSKPIKEWDLAPKGKRKLHVKLYEHCGKKFRVMEKTK
jgi:hypothetical protein